MVTTVKRMASSSGTSSLSASTGAVLVIGAALVWSTGGLLARLSAVSDPWVIVFWRTGTASLFLLGLIVKNIRGPEAAGVLGAGMLLLGWMTVPQTAYPQSLAGYASPLHPFLVIVVGPIAIIGLGWLVSLLTARATK